MGRYLERAENLARILSINETYARVDVPEDWERIFELYGDSTRVAELEGEGTSSVLYYCLFDIDNPRSVLSCLSAARENARSVRHLISTEMWRHMSVVHGGIREAAKQPTLQSVYTPTRETILGCQSIAGIAGGTLTRGEPWMFYEIGRFIERADQTTRILDIGFGRDLSDESRSERWSHINVLLRSVSAYHAYRLQHPGRSRLQEAVLFLLDDPAFPRSVSFCVAQLTEHLERLDSTHPNVSMDKVFADMASLKELLSQSQGAIENAATLNVFLDVVQIALNELSIGIGETYFPEHPSESAATQEQ